MFPQNGGFHKCTGGMPLLGPDTSFNPRSGLLGSAGNSVLMGLFGIFHGFGRFGH
jgi:hypothetical protein